MIQHCPGIKDLTTPQSITIRTCPKCGGEVEFFSDDFEVECPTCGRSLHREATNACVSWCEYALQCIADLKKRGLITQSKVEDLERIARSKT
ncbi:MAG: hypothetical protein L6N96_00700 [Candidatus Methylarchaceae archaeon HK02M2]|nr:hypothetical protein [Candidatus Methylarchaceae archaeon HK02M2]